MSKIFYGSIIHRYYIVIAYLNRNSRTKKQEPENACSAKHFLLYIKKMECFIYRYHYIVQEVCKIKAIVQAQASTLSESRLDYYREELEALYKQMCHDERDCHKLIKEYENTYK